MWMLLDSTVIHCIDFVMISFCYKMLQFLNQAHAGLGLVHAWFPKIDPVRTSVCVYVCVCVSAPDAINN